MIDLVDLGIRLWAWIFYEIGEAMETHKIKPYMFYIVGTSAAGGAAFYSALNGPGGPVFGALMIVTISHFLAGIVLLARELLSNEA